MNIRQLLCTRPISKECFSKTYPPGVGLSTETLEKTESPSYELVDPGDTRSTRETLL